MTTSKVRRIFRAYVKNPVAPDRLEVHDPGYLVVAEGKIEKLSHEDPRSQFPSAEFVDLGGKVIMPGFIDTHVHLPQLAIVGTGGDLLTWLSTYTYPEEARFADPEQAAGVRAYIGKVMMDRNSPPALQESADDSIAASLRLFEKWDGAEGGRLRYVFTPRFAGSCSMDLMKRAGQLAGERGAFVQSHLSENAGEVEWVRKLFPDYPSYSAVYDSAHLLSERCIMAHCIHLSPDEISLLAARRTNVAFCPYSNRNLHSGTMPYRRLRDAGLNISLGSDIAGGPSLSMLLQINEAMNAGGITFGEALYLATLGGAMTLGISDTVGNFMPGKDADFVVVHGESIEEVYVHGRRVYF